MLKVKRLNPLAKLPVKKFDSAAYDLYACEDVYVPARDKALIHTGISCEFPEGFVARICDRSSVAMNDGLHVMAGVIDANYRGEWKILLYNTTRYTKFVHSQTRVAQALLYEVAGFPVIEVEELSDTERGDGGFGSTGVK